ncbi:discoidin domain-containing protein [Actinoplanes sp. NBRC 103695]|uniref:discoidin domain-containing protein n=1 Tax=Actinoplanes sp. NBRC 103695 TaxID=3032202 RepID=UPI002553A9BD|nr:discoidin domain-containing protein [Actinoplanes sp. NBRC 103695]
MAAPRAGGAAEAAPVCTSSATTAASSGAAEALARRCGRKVENLAAKDESTREFASPGGTTIREIAAEPVRVRRGGGWVDIDPVLRRDGDGWSPGASTLPVTFSGGGADPLVAATAGGHRFTMSWPAPLPVPAITGDTATYRNVHDGVDLVVRATGTGFTHLLVVRSAAAAANPALRKITYTFGGTGTKVAPVPDGYRVTDPRGRTLFTSVGAAMWDSSGNRAGDGARRADVGMRVSADRLVLVPDRDLLAKATYPLYIDPPTIRPGASRWAYSNNRNENNDLSTVRVGRDPEGGAIYRPFLEFPMSIAGTRVVSATMSIVLWHSWSCSPSPVTLWRAGPIASSPKNQWGATPLDYHLDTQWADANKDQCYKPDTPTLYFGNKLAGDLQYGPADRGWGSYTVALSAGDEGGLANESTTSRWKKFLPGTATLTVQYNHPPRAPGLDGMSIDPGQPCAAQPLYVNALNGVTLRARLTDEDGDNITARWRVSGLPGGSGPPDSTPAAGGEFTTTIPAAAFTDGRSYTWSVAGWDGFHEGGGSAGCAFTVSNTLPGDPVVTSSELALTTGLLPPPPPAGVVVGGPAGVRLAPAAGDDDIAGYLVGVGAGTPITPTLWIPAGADGTAVAPVAPATAGPAPNILTVRARNKAGTSGTTAVYRFDANPTTRRAEADDLTGDGRSDLVYLRDVDGRATVWMSATRNDGSGSFDPVQVFDGGDAYPAATSRLAGGDYDGDGDTDLVLLRQLAGGRADASVLHSNGNVLFAQPAFWDSGDAGWDLTTMQVSGADVTGDGKADLVAARPETTGWTARVFVSAATGPGAFTFAAPAAWSTAEPSSGAYARTVVRTADLDGDGRADLARVQDNGNGQVKVFVQTSTGSGFADPVAWFDSGPDRWDFDRLTVLAGNVSGTSKADLTLLHHAGNGVTSAIALLSDGSRLTSSQFWHSGGPDSFDPARAKVVAGDFTGGPEADLAVLYDQGLARSRYSLLGSTGSAFSPAARWTAPLDWTRLAVEGGGTTPNLAAGATAGATSTAATFAPGQAVDGHRTSNPTNGWSSWSNLDNDHAETIDVLLPAWKYTDRVDIYPRNDGTNVGTSFPANFTVDVWTPAGWRTVASRENLPNPGAAMVSVSFGARWTDHVRITGTNLRVMQLAEIEVYLIGRGAPPANLALHGTASASSSAPEDWGWAPKWAVDGTRGLPGWSSWANQDADHTEWIELTLPRSGPVNRVDLYPRPDGGGNFCRDFTIEAYWAREWRVMSRQTGYPAPTSGAVRSFPFPTVQTDRIRVVCTGVRLVQLAEIEAYLTQ